MQHNMGMGVDNNWKNRVMGHITNGHHKGRVYYWLERFPEKSE